MSVKLLTEHNLEFLSLKGGCVDSSESTLFKMPHGWKSHVTAQIGSNNPARPFSRCFVLYLNHVNDNCTRKAYCTLYG